MGDPDGLAPRRGEARLPRGASATGPGALVVGILLLAAGAGLGLVGLNSGGHPEVRPAGLAMGGAFSVIGVAVLWQGARGLLARARRRRVLSAHPGEPWLADHPWRREGIVDDTASQVRRALVGGGAMSLVVSLFASTVLEGFEGPGLFVVIAVLGAFMAIGLGLLARGVYLLMRRSRHGLAELRFGRFPFLLGGPLEVALLREAGAPRLDGLTATLRCVVEKWVEREAPGGDSSHLPASRALVREVVWQAARRIPFVQGERIPVRFELPPPGGAAVGTALSADPPRYWELSLAADLPGLDFAATFLVPVYDEQG